MNRMPVPRMQMQSPRPRMALRGMRPALNSFTAQPYQHQQQQPQYFQGNSETIDQPDDIIQIDDNDDDVIEIDEVELNDYSHSYQQPMQAQLIQNYSQPSPQPQMYNQYQQHQNFIQPNQIQQAANLAQYEDILTPTLENSTVYDIAEVEESIEQPEVTNYAQPNNAQVNVFPNYSNNGTQEVRSTGMAMVDFEQEEQLARLPSGIQIKRQPVTDHGLVELD